MIDLNYLAVVVAAVATFVFAAVYYSLLAAEGAKLSAAWAETSRPSASMVVLELVKALVVASVVAGLVALIGITDLPGGLLFGLVLWIAFPVVLLAGSVAHEHVPVKLAAIHAGDWLVKLLLAAGIVAVWR